jgi:hypothetical protein
MRLLDHVVHVYKEPRCPFIPDRRVEWLRY